MNLILFENNIFKKWLHIHRMCNIHLRASVCVCFSKLDKKNGIITILIKYSKDILFSMKGIIIHKRFLL
jgi:hypothetical protein